MIDLDLSSNKGIGGHTRTRADDILDNIGEISSR